MVYTTTSAGAVIAKIYRDLGTVQHPNWEQDAIEWVGEALGHIGVGPQLVKLSQNVEVESHTGELPPNFIRLIEVFHFPGIETLEEVTDNDSASPLAFSGRTNPPVLLTAGRDPVVGDDGFYISGGNLVTTFEKGVLQVLYYGLETDDDGYPLVPDDPTFGEAFMWYITMKLIMGRKWDPPPGIDFNTAKKDWKTYCAQARSKAKMPSLPALDQFVHQWNKTVNLRNRRTDFFQGDNVPHSSRIYGRVS